MLNRILAVEDDEVSAQVLSGILQTHHYRVSVAARSADAWPLIRKHLADVLILDTNLDGEQGWQFLDAVRRHPFFAGLPTIVYSGVSQRDIVQRYLRLGVQGMLVKPYSPDRLLPEIARLTATCWRDKLFEPLDDVRRRTGLADGPLAELYRTAALEIDQILVDVSVVLTRDPGDQTAIKRVTSLRTTARNAGFPALEKVVNDAERGAATFENELVVTMLTELPTATAILRDRAARIAPEAIVDEEARNTEAAADAPELSAGSRSGS